MPLGLEDGRVPDPLIRASSSQSYYCKPFNARLNRRRVGKQGGAWCAKRSDKNQWLLVDFGALTRVKAVATQGRQNSAQWVTKYYIAYSKNGYQFFPYKEGGKTKVKSSTCLYLFYFILQNLVQFVVSAMSGTHQPADVNCGIVLLTYARACCLSSRFYVAEIIVF